MSRLSPITKYFPSGMRTGPKSLRDRRPGWTATINLQDTELADKPFAEVRDQYQHETLWLRCWREEQRFEIRCGPVRFADGLRIFLAWAAPSKPRLQTNRASPGC